MTFASKSFLFYFLPLFLLCYFSFKGIRARNVIVIAFSVAFYSALKPLYLLILMASIGANYRLAIAIDKADPRRRYRLLGYGAAGNILVLAIFKYVGFVVVNLNTLLEVSGVTLPVPKLPLPLGISFYTFHAISYIADIAKRRVAANRRFDEFMLYMSMFPQLVSGPIVRYATVARQLRDRRHTVGRFSAGMRIFVIGLAWKVLLADQVAPIANSLFDHIPSPNLQEAWLGLLAYGLEIYFDFGGYSTMAVGLGLMIGFTLPRNFRIPYSAESITAFWRRWHMSLSAWLRDYVYIPLGGNRGTKLRTYANLWTVFLLCGLWHGASWTFVIWGAHHGLFLVLERAGLGRILGRLPRPMAQLYTLLVVFAGWIWFRANGFDEAVTLFRSLLGLNGMDAMSADMRMSLTPFAIAAMVMGALIGMKQWRLPRLRRCARSIVGETGLAFGDNAWVVVVLILCILEVGADAFSPFLYYRF